MAKTMFDDVQLDANLASILGPYSGTSNHGRRATGLISSFYRLRTSRDACVTISAALGLVLFSGTAILFDRVTVALNGLQEPKNLSDQSVVQLARPPANPGSTGVAIRSSSVSPELRDTSTGEQVSLRTFTHSMSKAKLSRQSAQPDLGFIREGKASEIMRDSQPDAKPVRYETAPADGAIALEGGKVMPLLDPPSLTQVAGEGSSGDIAIETDRSEISHRVRRDTVDAIRALRRQW